MTHIGLTAKEMMNKLNITCWVSNQDGRVWVKDRVTNTTHIATFYEQNLYKQSLKEYFETGFNSYNYED